ncbi:hypothetical protein NDU88_004009 [Pleurodeles waltl]|uniref:Uncharacterized protein n=1 Tax=Pleurodeles waltl TaxID=8319 RepID=A0AAV7W6L6_PLEWA|nr:hypothetical protein NDU88_004009 [Pleurodeles waltl]
MAEEEKVRAALTLLRHGLGEGGGPRDREPGAQGLGRRRSGSNGVIASARWVIGCPAPERLRSGRAARVCPIEFQSARRAFCAMRDPL